MKYNDISISISGVKGNKRNYSYINNIPVSLINSVHKIYLTADTQVNVNSNYYFIKVDSIASADYTDEISDIQIIFKNITYINI